MLKRRFENIITYLRQRITNAAGESINAKIQWVKYTARGFRNKQNFINAIYFHCGGRAGSTSFQSASALPRIAFMMHHLVLIGNSYRVTNLRESPLGYQQ